MANEKFCLKWNDFEQNISGAFRELKDDADFFDVTLACDSDEHVSAHKVILSACSPFFRQVLRRHKHQHPLLYLRGVSFSDLESVLAFMYNGEVNIAQEQLNSFLAVAEDLKVKGLTQGKDGGQTDRERSKSPRHPSPATTTSYKPSSQRNSTVMSQPPPKRARAEPTNYQDDDEIQEVVPVKTEIGATDTKLDVAGYEEESYEDYGGYEEQQYDGAAGAMVQPQTGMEIAKDHHKNPEELYQYIVRNENGYYCSICLKPFKNRKDGRDHCEAIHFKDCFEYTCEFCGIKLKSNFSYKTHKSRKHREEKNFV